MMPFFRTPSMLSVSLYGRRTVLGKVVVAETISLRSSTATGHNSSFYRQQKNNSMIISYMTSANNNNNNINNNVNGSCAAGRRGGVYISTTTNTTTTKNAKNTITAATSTTEKIGTTIINNEQRRSLAFQKSFHYDTPYNNNTDTHFDFTTENYKRVAYILGKYPENYKQAAMIPLLDLAQRQYGGWLPLAAMHKVAQICEVAPVRVYEVASFYSMFNRTPVGKYFIQLCGTTPCMICGSEDIKRTIEKHLHIKDGETTKDGMFTLLEVECLGACANAPMIQLNDDYYECLTPTTMIELLEACKVNKVPPPGKWGSLPMNGQVSCEGPKGKTSLFTVPTSPPPIDVERFKDGAVDPASVKKHMSY